MILKEDSNNMKERLKS